MVLLYVIKIHANQALGVRTETMTAHGGAVHPATLGGALLSLKPFFLAGPP
jgi:hypothetical protein